MRSRVVALTTLLAAVALVLGTGATARAQSDTQIDETTTVPTTVPPTTAAPATTIKVTTTIKATTTTRRVTTTTVATTSTTEEVLDEEPLFEDVDEETTTTFETTTTTEAEKSDSSDVNGATVGLLVALILAIGVGAAVVFIRMRRQDTEPFDPYGPDDGFDEYS